MVASECSSKASIRAEKWMDGKITYENFLSGCERFLQKIKLCESDWQQRSAKFDQELKYLIRKSIQNVTNKVREHDSSSDLGSKGKYSEEYLEDNDDAACKQVQSSTYIQVAFEHHIIYNISYGVPVLYFTAMTTDGKSLSLDEIWKQVPKCYSNTLVGKWSFLTQTEHPILGYPVFHIHPCNTSKMMKNLLSSDNTNEDELRYIVIWLSALGPLAGLQLPLEVFKEEE